MKLSQGFRLALLALILVCAVGCDQTSKHFARTKLGAGSVQLPGGFGEFRVAENPGSFLSLGASLAAPLRTGFLTIGVGLGLALLCAYLLRSSQLTWMPFTALALIWAGGMSNFIDRLTRNGHVTDFLFLQIGPLHTGVFNMADVLIMLGIASLAWDLWRRREGRAVPLDGPK